MIDSQIVEYSSIAALMQHLPNDRSSVLVIFDIDNTLIRPQGWLGGSSWFEYTLHQKVAAGMTHQEAYASVVELCMQFQPYLTWLPVEQETIAVVQSLQKSGVKVVAMTGRSADQTGLTHEQLDKVQLSFADSSPSVEVVDSWYTVHDGVIFSSFYEKGKVLVDFLSKTSIQVTTVICVDDMLRNIQSIERELTKKRPDVAYVGVRYTHLDALSDTFNPAEVDTELKAIMAKIDIQSISNIVGE